MTLNTQTPRVVITGNGTRGPYNFTDSSSQAIRAISTSHIRLTRYAASTDDNNDGTLLVENTDYTIGGTQDARTFTLASGQDVLTSSQRIVADRVQGYNQDLDLTTGGAFNAASIESRFDKVAEFQQELKSRLDRVPALQFADATANVAFPSPPTSATQFLARNTSGEIIYATAADLDVDVALGSGWAAPLGTALGSNWATAFAATLGTNWSTALAATLGTGWSTQLARARTAVMYVFLDVTVGTGASGAQQIANTTAMNAAITTAGTRVILPPGTILFDGAWLPKADNVTISGCGENITICRFSHSGDCITVGTGGFDANAFTVEDFTPQQASGTGYFIHHRKGRKITVRRCGGQAYSGNRLRKFLKLGNVPVAVTNVVNNGSGACRVTAASHGYTSNDYVLVNRVAGATGVNGLFRVTVIDANTFDLISSTFGGAYTSGGATCPYALFCIIEEIDELDVSLDGIDVYSHSGELRINGFVLVGKDFTASVPTTGSRGLKIHSGNAFDRFDGLYGRGLYGFIEFDVNFEIDNTRVTNIQMPAIGLDLYKTGAMRITHDNTDDTGGGTEHINFDGMKIANAYTGGGNVVVFDATDSDIAGVTMRGLIIEGLQSGVVLIGDSAAATIIAELTISGTGVIRATSGTHDGLNISGGVRNIIVESYSCRSVTAAYGRDVIRLESTTTAGAVTVLAARGHNFTGVSDVNDVGGGALCERVVGLTKTAFNLEINNNGGTIRHRIVALGSTATAALARHIVKITGATDSYTNTTSGADASTAMTGGGKISSATTNVFVLNTASQTSLGAVAPKTEIVFNDTGAALYVRPVMTSRNVNGVTQVRLELQLSNTAGAAAIDTATIPSGDTIVIAIEVNLL